jgi:hypothetical protein
MVHVQAIIVKQQLQRMSKVPRVSADDTKLTVLVGVEHVVWNVVYPCARFSQRNRKGWRDICRDDSWKAVKI